MAIDNIVTMGWELAHSVCIDLEDRHGQGPEPQPYDTINYFPVEKEPGKFAIGMFTDDFTLLGYIKTDKGA